MCAFGAVLGASFLVLGSWLRKGKGGNLNLEFWEPQTGGGKWGQTQNLKIRYRTPSLFDSYAEPLKERRDGGDGGEIMVVKVFPGLRQPFEAVKPPKFRILILIPLEPVLETQSFENPEFAVGNGFLPDDVLKDENAREPA